MEESRAVQFFAAAISWMLAARVRALLCAGSVSKSKRGKCPRAFLFELRRARLWLRAFFLSPQLKISSLEDAKTFACNFWKERYLPAELDIK